MSRPDLYDLALTNGGPRLIPAALCESARIGRDRVWNVLAHRLMYADAVGVMAWGQPAIAKALDLDRRLVREADDVLIAAGLMEPAGKRSRANAYRMLPRLLDAMNRAHDEPDVAGDMAGNMAGEVAGDMAGDMAGNMAGMPSTKGREGKVKWREDARVHASRPPSQSMAGSPPDPCPKHPNGWRHDESCRQCGDIRRWSEGRRVEPPARQVETCPHERLSWECDECIAGFSTAAAEGAALVRQLMSSAGRLPA